MRELGASRGGGPLRSYPLAVRAGMLSVAGGVVILGLKFAAWYVTGSSVLLADAAESIVNVIAAAMATYSVAVAARPADADHPYGHGRAETLSAAIEGALIALAATVIVAESIGHIVTGPQLHELGTGLIVSGLAGLGNLALALYLLRVGQRARSEAIRADGTHILTDVITTAGALAALLIVKLTGFALLDPIVALLVAANILRTGWHVLRQAITGLLDEADFDLITRIAEHLEARRPSEWIEIHQLRARRSGPSHHLDLHLTVPRYLTMEVAHRLGDSLERSLRAFVGEGGDVVVHLDPCEPIQCRSCAMPDCPVRSDPLDKRPPFDRRSLTKPGLI
ncbi:MAG: cation diffusion facilitator family transporter [Myxococcota bacterium]